MKICMLGDAQHVEEVIYLFMEIDHFVLCFLYNGFVLISFGGSISFI